MENKKTKLCSKRFCDRSRILNRKYLTDFIENDMCLKISNECFEKVFNSATIKWHTLNYSLLLQDMMKDKQVEMDIKDVIYLKLIGIECPKSTTLDSVDNLFEVEINKYLNL